MFRSCANAEKGDLTLKQTNWRLSLHHVDEYVNDVGSIAKIDKHGLRALLVNKRNGNVNGTTVAQTQSHNEMHHVPNAEVGANQGAKRDCYHLLDVGLHPTCCSRALVRSLALHGQLHGCHIMSWRFIGVLSNKPPRTDPISH